MDLQRMIDAMSDVTRNTRSDYHLTLAGLIEALKEADPKAIVLFDWNRESPNYPHSYRGYYSDLSFHWKGNELTVESFLEGCEDSLGRTFTGWKGGDFIMDKDTLLWAADFGDTGRAIIAIHGENPVILITKEVD